MATLNTREVEQRLRELRALVEISFVDKVERNLAELRALCELVSHLKQRV